MPRRYHLVVGDGEIEALELTPEKLDVAVSWTRGVEVVEIDPLDNRLRFVAINIPTSSGHKRASEGDFIIKDALGNLTVMGPNEFRSKYIQNEKEEPMSERYDGFSVGKRTTEPHHPDGWKSRDPGDKPEDRVDNPARGTVGYGEHDTPNKD